MKQFKDTLEAECKLNQCTYEIISMKDPLFENYNNETCSEIARNAVKKYMGEEASGKGPAVDGLREHAGVLKVLAGRDHPHRSRIRRWEPEPTTIRRSSTWTKRA